MPFEIIVHDDHGEALESLDVKDKVSTIILNLGLNFGLPTASNRAIRLSTSKYILFINQDCEMTMPCLRDYANVLDKPYVGIISPWGDGDIITSPEYINASGTKFTLTYGIGAGCVMAFRRDFWENVGGFEEDTISGCSDTPLLYKMWREGYFRALLLGPKRIRNVDYEEYKSSHSTIGRTGTDCCYPKIFPHTDQALRIQSKKREQFCQRHVDRERYEPASISNVDYWHEYSQKILPQPGMLSSMNWENGKKHGQFKWKESIEKEIVHNV